MWKTVMSRIRPTRPSPTALMEAAEALRKSSQPMLMRLKMMVKLAKILGRDSAPASSSSSSSSKRRPRRVIDTRAKPSAKVRQARILNKMRSALGRKPRKTRKPKSHLWERAHNAAAATAAPGRPTWDLLLPENVEPENEPEITIELSSKVERPRTTLVVYNFTSGYFEEVVEDEPLLDLLTLHSKVTLKEDLDKALHRFGLQWSDSEDSGLEQLAEDSRREMEEVYQGVVTREELMRIDAQPNPFNYSDRVSQTTPNATKELAMQTEPPPPTCFSVNVGEWDIHDAYMNDQLALQRLQQEIQEKEKEKDAKKVAVDPLVVLGMEHLGARNRGGVSSGVGGGDPYQANLTELRRVARVVERMVTQNIYDDISQDFKYWEDGSDEYHPLQGSLLPLWKFRPEISRHLTVSDVCCSPVLPDLFAAAYTDADAKEEIAGLLCVYTLKNPVSPERVYHTPSGVTSIHFHPKVGRLLAAGWSDGRVVLYDVCPTTPRALSCTITSGKHLLPVTQVRWIETSPGEDVSFFSVAQDGRLTQWHLRDSCRLTHADVFEPHLPRTLGFEVREGGEGIVLLGLDSGAVFQCSMVCVSHSLFHYPAHSSVVRDLAWNIHHSQVFLSCSLDWSIKVWFQHSKTPLVVLDVGGAVAGVAWSPYNSSVLVAITDECRAFVFDLSVRVCTPLCVQPMAQRRPLKASCVTFSPFYPIIFIGGEKGHLSSFKLSPNLRRVQKEMKDGEPRDTREVERGKIEKVIASNR
ncbi:dynein axonemal intermediate chain 1-like isoform X2 [Eriocheir sinensis]|uniref:dynein axonemal intermediate chain 1-like isoform X2 n=1 Tax=Eriocheir sinensis TaxID=95602 RepID=UPI0021C9CDF9|nr:dynein axonemal intermediate chain 1-like isoform X2 [Eriocheir sinensis]